MSQGLQNLLRIDRNTANLERAIAFHRDALGFRTDDANAAAPAWTSLPGLCRTTPRSARLSLGAQTLLLTEFPGAAPYPEHGAANDSCFQHCAIVVDDMPAAYARVMAHRATPITRGGPQTLPPATGPVSAFKFRDPDGHPLELIAFPDGVGDPVWQSMRSDGPMLGIDHSAISVADVDRSIRFYESLGLRAVARGVNHGVEQVRLDDLADVEVEVVAMQGMARTPHLELLGYLRPGGRTNAANAPSAVAADCLVWQTENVGVLLDALVGTGFAGNIVARGGDQRIALLRDPDGHLLSLLDSAI